MRPRGRSRDEAAALARQFMMADSKETRGAAVVQSARDLLRRLTSAGGPENTSTSSRVEVRTRPDVTPLSIKPSVEAEMQRSFPGFLGRESGKRRRTSYRRRPKPLELVFYLLPKCFEKVPSEEEFHVHQCAGLGRRTVSINIGVKHGELSETLKGHYPALNTMTGGFLLYKADGGWGRRKLFLIPPKDTGYTGLDLKGLKVLYIAPAQGELSTEPLPFDHQVFSSMPRARCMKCQLYVPLLFLPKHVKSCDAVAKPKSPEVGNCSVCPLCSKLFSAEDIHSHVSACEQRHRDVTADDPKPGPSTSTAVHDDVKENQEKWCSSMNQTDSKPLCVKEEEEEEDISQIPFGVLKTEDVAPGFKTEEDDCEAPEPGGASRPDLDLERPSSSDSHTDDSEDWNDGKSSLSVSNSETGDNEKSKSWNGYPEGTYILEPVGVCVGEGGKSQTLMSMRKVDTVPPNSVRSLIQNPFQSRSLAEQLEVKRLGPEQGEIKLRQQETGHGRTSTRTFHKEWYKKKPWLTGCSHANALFCFPCLLFKETPWDTLTDTGCKDLKHLSERIKKHEGVKTHILNVFKLAMFGNISVAEQLHERTRVGARHNEEVDKNRQTLSKMIDCVKFCGAFELASHDPCDTNLSGDAGVFRGLVDLVASLEAGLQNHLGTSIVFGGESKAVLNQLLDCMLTVLQNHILDEVKEAHFLAVQADEISDFSAGRQLVLILRYIDALHDVQERFFEFIPLENASAAGVAAVLLERLHKILPDRQRSKLIAQAYDGGARGDAVQLRVKEAFTAAHYVHCYAHHLHLIVQQVTSHIHRIRTFFSDLEGFEAFFSHARRAAVLDQVVARRSSPPVSWTFHSHAVSTVFEHKQDLLSCFTLIRDSTDFDPQTVREAGSFLKMLEDEDFNFSLKLFYKIMPHAETLFNQMQSSFIDLYHINRAMQAFIVGLRKIRDSIPSLCEEHTSAPLPSKRARTSQTQEQQLATEVCDAILSHMKKRFGYTGHLISATLLRGDMFAAHDVRFPDAALDAAVEAHPVLDKAKLRTELQLIYEDQGFRDCGGLLPLFRFFMEKDLQGTFSETVGLLRILITTPMTTAEAGRCFPTLKRIKNFLKSTVTQDRLNALAMLSMEKDLVRKIPDFNNQVIERFADLDGRREKFMYK